MNKLLKSALWYLARGLPAFPCRPRDKKPLIKWEPYQRECPRIEQVEQWWKNAPEANVAIAMGRGMIAVDLDGDGAEGLLTARGICLPPEAPRVKTGNGWHVYLAVTERIENCTALLDTDGHKPQVDIRGDGGYVIAPPSVHENGNVYTWRVVPPVFPPPAAPESLLALIRAFKHPGHTEPHSDAPPKENQGWVADALRGVGDGKRDNTATRLAGYFVTRRIPEDVTKGILYGFADRCLPAFAHRDIDRIYASIAKTNERHGGQQEENQTQARPVTIQHVSESITEVRNIVAAGPQRTAQTPFPSLNTMLSGGFSSGELILLGGRPGTGKTAFALEMARSASKAGDTVLVVSREMIAAALTRRMLSQQGQIHASTLKTGRLLDWNRLDQASAALSALPIWLTDSALNVQDVELAIQAVPYHLDFLIVDYLQLMRAPINIRERRLQVENISQNLKTMAIRHEMPILCLSSLSRPAEGKDKRPTMGSLRESGELEHDADIVILLHREQGEEKTECMLVKNRDGETGMVNLIFRPEWVSFSELAEASEVPESWVH